MALIVRHRSEAWRRCSLCGRFFRRIFWGCLRRVFRLAVTSQPACRLGCSSQAAGFARIYASMQPRPSRPALVWRHLLIQCTETSVCRWHKLAVESRPNAPTGIDAHDLSEIESQCAFALASTAAPSLMSHLGLELKCLCQVRGASAARAAINCFEIMMKTRRGNRCHYVQFAFYGLLGGPFAPCNHSDLIHMPTGCSHVFAISSELTSPILVSVSAASRPASADRYR